MGIYDQVDKFKETKDALSKVSPSFCVAKWNQVTLHLATGNNHSCHHPAVHKIPITEIQQNPAALHNTSFKKIQRKFMLEGVRPKECDYCWRAEDAHHKNENEGEVYSDRVTKSSESWARPYLDKISQLPWDADVNPTYLEVSFDTVCNFKCIYCSPAFSTTWKQEIAKHGPYEMPGLSLHSLDYLKQTGSYPIAISEHNPYIEAFWKWWPEAVKDLQVFRITGGEPLLSKQVFRVLDYLIENPQPQLEFAINSNLDSPQEMIDLFIEKMKIIQEKKAVKQFKLYTSCEAYGKQAEYIRFGLNYDRWIKNCHRILRDIPDSYLTFMASFNLLSIPSFTKFMDDVLMFKRTYTIQPVRSHPVSLDIPYVRWPEFLAPWIATENYLETVSNAVTYMYKNLQQTHWPPLCGNGFFDYEVNRFRRLYFIIRDEMRNLNNNIEKKILLRKQFASYILEYDKRKGTNFIETFPEYEEFYKHCLTVTEESIKHYV